MRRRADRWLLDLDDGTSVDVESTFARLPRWVITDGGYRSVVYRRKVGEPMPADLNSTIPRQGETEHTTMQYTIVALNADNKVGHRIRTFDDYPTALGYLMRNLPKRKNLDLQNSKGEFVSWEFDCPVVGVERVPAPGFLDDAEQTLINAALMHYAEHLGVKEAESLAGRLSPALT